MSSSIRQPKHVLLQIIVGSDLKTTVRSYYEGRDATNPVHVNVGDRVAFLVQLYTGGRKPVPYEINFSDGQFFGVPSLVVANGGVSDFLIVRALAGTTSYSMSIPGIGCVLDPEIQSGSDGPRIKQGITAAPANFLITWDTGSNTMSYVNSTDPNAKSWPMVVSLQDNVSFAVTGAAVSEASIVFEMNQNAWATPFDPNNNILKLPSLHGGPYSVKDSFENPGALFPFNGKATVGPKPLVSPTYSIEIK